MNKYRLSSKSFERETEDEKILPYKVYFLAVEGNHTEKEYFEGLSKYRTTLGINARVNVIVLNRSRRDTNSTPDNVLELLEEYIRLRDSSEKKYLDIPEDFTKKYGEDFIITFLNTPEKLTHKERNAFVNDLRNLGYDIYYRRYLSKYDGDYDEFCIMIDRDVHSHSKESLKKCIDHCKNNGYRFFITNPCFEFWLLLHLSDVKAEYSDRLEQIKENEKVSANHTFVSNEVSKKAHHGKSGIGFKTNYLPNIPLAIQRAKDFEADPEKLLDNIGCNLHELITEMMSFSPKNELNTEK